MARGRRPSLIWSRIEDVSSAVRSAPVFVVTFRAVVLMRSQSVVSAGEPVLSEYFQTGLVPRFPTLIVCCFVLVAALLLFISGIILSSQLAKDARDFEFQLQTVHHWRTHKKD